MKLLKNLGGIIKMVEKTGQNQNQGESKKIIAHKFQDYREHNDKIIIWVRKFTRIIRDVRAYKDNNVSDGDVLTSDAKLIGSDSKYKDIFNLLAKDLDQLADLCEELNNSINGESTKINEFLGQEMYDDVQTRNFLIKTIQTYNMEKFNVVKKMVAYVPALDTDLKNLISVPELREKDTVSHFIEFYNGLVQGVIYRKGISKGIIFINLSKILIFFNRYFKSVENLYYEDQTHFLKIINKMKTKGSAEPKEFAVNFFKSGFVHHVDDLNKLMRDLKLGVSSLDNDKSYNSLEKDEKIEVDKFIERVLRDLFAFDITLKARVDSMYDTDKKDSGDLISDDVDKNLDSVKSKFNSFLVVVGPAVGDYQGFSNMELSNDILEKSKQPFRGLFDALLGDEKDNIKEDSGNYSCERFNNLLKKIDKFHDKQATSIFLKFCLDNFENLSSGNYDSNLISSFFRNLSAVTSIVGFHK